MGFTQESVWLQVQSLLPGIFSQEAPSLCVGFSGGLDSSVLLHILSEIQLTQDHRFSLKAIHINHQLQTDAKLWAGFCQEFCDAKNVSLQVINVDVVSAKKLGTEAAARAARYNAFKDNLSPQDILLTAHHLDDQVETVFLHLLRGTGIEGACGIKPCSKFGDNYLLRPLLTFNRQQLMEYAIAQKLQWIDDPSNSQTHFNRNYLRHEVLPTIEKRWPAYRNTIQRFANNSRSVKTALDDSIAKDFAVCFEAKNNSLLIESLRQLSFETRMLVIRYWIKRQNYSLPGEAVLLQIHTAMVAEEDANPLVKWGDAVLRRYRNEIFLLSRNGNDFQKGEFSWDLQTLQTIEGLGELSSQKLVGQGIHEKYVDAKIKIVFRQGGEKCQLPGRQGRHSLKKLFQEFAIPPWRRDRIPLLMIDNQIAAVIGYFYCAPFAAGKNELGFAINLG